MHKSASYESVSIPLLFSGAIGLYLFAFTPLRFYLASPLLYPANFDSIYKLFLLFAATTLLVIFVWLITKSLAGEVLLGRLFVFLYSIFILGILLSPQPGVLDGKYFRDEYLIKNPVYKYDLIIMALAIFAAVFASSGARAKRVIKLGYLIIVIVCVSIISDIYKKKLGVFAPGNMEEATAQSNGANKKPIPHLQLTKTGLNVVILMADMFTGDSFGKVIDSSEELKAAFEGYTWYPDTLSVGRATVAGELAIIAGYERSPALINHLHKQKYPIKDIWEKAFNPLIEMVRDRNSVLNIWGPVAYTGHCNTINMVAPSDYKSKGGLRCFDNIDVRENYFKSDLPSSYYPLYSTPIFGMFFAASPFVRGKLYRSKLWEWALDGQETFLFEANYSSENLHHLRMAFSNIELTESDLTISYINSKVAHNPWILDKKCRPLSFADFMSKNFDSADYSQINGERCTLLELARFNQLIKNQGVFDNTVIIAVSDHDNDNSSTTLINSVGHDKLEGFAAHALFLIKGANDRGTLKTSDALLSNSDVLPIVKCYIESEGSDRSKCVPVRKDRYRFTASTPAHIETQGEYEFKINKISRIYGSMFSRANWTETTTDDPLIPQGASPY